LGFGVQHADARRIKGRDGAAMRVPHSGSGRRVVGAEVVGAFGAETEFAGTAGAEEAPAGEEEREDGRARNKRVRVW